MNTRTTAEAQHKRNIDASNAAIEVQELKMAFQQIDADGTGLINAEELKAIMVQKEVSISNKEIEEMINQIDYHGNKMINYSEFLAATIDTKNFLTDSRLRVVFNSFDTDSSNFITKENIYIAMQKLGRQITMGEIDEIIRTHDKTGDGKLCFDEFRAVFFDGKAQEEAYSAEEFDDAAQS